MLTLKVLISNNFELQQVLKKSIKKRYKMQQKNLKYCMQSKVKRAARLQKPYPMNIRKMQRNNFKLLCGLMKLRTRMDGIVIKELNPYVRSGRKPVIFVPAHIGKFDIEVAYECINEYALLLSGTEERMHGTLDGLFLKINGVNYVDRGDKTDRHIAMEQQKMDLDHGFNLLWFIEGTWNLSENQLIYPLSYSVIKTALECDVEIVPIGLHQSEKIVYVNFGKSYKPDAAMSLENSILELRDKLAALKWELYEYCEMHLQTGISIEEYKQGNYLKKYYCTPRKTLKSDYWAKCVMDMVNEWPITDLLEECEYIFMPKTEAYQFFEEFNTRVMELPEKRKMQRI